MKILVAGGTGFVGSNLVNKLIDNNHDVFILARKPLEISRSSESNINVILKDPSDSLVGLDEEFDVIINCVGIIREFPSKGITFQSAHVDVVRNLLEFAARKGIGRFIQISALGVGPEKTTGYQKTKHEAELLIKQAMIDYTIFKPSVIYGSGDGFVATFAGMIKKYPVLPIIGNGRYKLQPVYIDDLTDCILKSLNDKNAYMKSFEIGGPEVSTFSEIIDEISDALNKKPAKLYIPAFLLKVQAALLGRFSFFPVTVDQISMLLEDNFTHDNSCFERYGITPRRFAKGLKSYLK
jgi:NADH dehydrogenase